MQNQSHTTNRLMPSQSPSNSYSAKTTPTPALLLQGTLPSQVQDFVVAEFHKVPVGPFLQLGYGTSLIGACHLQARILPLPVPALGGDRMALMGAFSLRAVNRGICCARSSFSILGWEPCPVAHHHQG